MDRDCCVNLVLYYQSDVFILMLFSVLADDGSSNSSATPHA